MTKSRLEAFSDGVIAIIITIMVLEIKVPHDASLNALWKLFPVFLSYVLSFVFICIYWGNHHHLLHTASRVNARIIWSNAHLLFWLSMIPFTTGWMGENHFDRNPVVLYSVNLLLCAVAFYLLQMAITASHSKASTLATALKKQEKKGILSLVLYLLSIPAAFLHPGISAVIFVFTAILWVIPDKRIEKALEEHS